MLSGMPTQPTEPTSDRQEQPVNNDPQPKSKKEPVGRLANELIQLSGGYVFRIRIKTFEHGLRPYFHQIFRIQFVYIIGIQFLVYVGEYFQILSDLEIMTDSATVFGWLSSLLSSEKPVRSRGLSEILVKRRLSLIEDLMHECKIKLRVSKVRSECNKADRLTRVPKSWLVSNSCHAAVETGLKERMIRDSHEQHHFGVCRTLAILKAENPNLSVTKADVRSIVSSCDQCLSIDPAPVHYQHGTFSVQSVWERIAVDVTHVNGRPFLSVIDCGPSRFAIWKPLKAESASEVGSALHNIFCEFGPPTEVLTDNGAAFTSSGVKELCSRWHVELVYRAAKKASR